MKKQEAKKEIQRLEKEVRKHQMLYYQQAMPIISDREYDLLFDRLKELEQKYPELMSPNSPTQVVGSDLDNAFETVKHTIPVLSLENTYSTEEALKWASKFKKESVFSVEWKIDGASLVLYYKNGELDKAVSRGTGGEGDDITNNIKTVKNLPLVLEKPETVAVRGEVFMTFADFEEVNRKANGRYANPRNLVAGSIKQKKSSQAAERPLRITVYDAYFEKASFETHQEIIQYLHELGLPTEAEMVFASKDELKNAIETKKQGKSQLAYPTDGMVIKLNSLREREELGYTRSTPRYAIALKLEQEEVATVVEEIELFVGRTGKITPRARVTPVEIAGTTVTYATLHNEKYIQDLGLSLGSTVLVSKRGEIIPAVEKVVFPGPGPVFTFPKNCPSCGVALVKDPEFADHFCPSPYCKQKQIARLQFFAQRKQMDISGLSDTTIETLYEKGFLKEIPDFYRLKDRQAELESMKGFGKKSVKLMLEGIEASRSRPFKFVLPALGLKEIGQNVTELLIAAGYSSLDEIIQFSQQPDLEKRLLEDKEIPGIGPKTVEMLRKHFSNPEVLQLIQTLKAEQLQMSAPKTQTENNHPPVFQGQTWVVTGSFAQFKPREKALEEIQKRGGKTTSAVSSKSTHLLAGENAGSKETKAKELGVKVVTEAEFLKMLATAPSVEASVDVPSEKKTEEPEKKAEIKKSEEKKPASQKARGTVEKKVSSEEKNTKTLFHGQIWYLVGTLEQISKEKAIEAIEQGGGAVTSSLLWQNTHLLAGKKPGSHYQKALEMGINVISEEEFLEKIQKKGLEKTQKKLFD